MKDGRDFKEDYQEVSFNELYARDLLDIKQIRSNEAAYDSLQE